MAYIISKFAAKCARCGAPIAAGTEAWYLGKFAPKGKRMVCRPCQEGSKTDATAHAVPAKPAPVGGLDFRKDHASVSALQDYAAHWPDGLFEGGYCKASWLRRQSAPSEPRGKTFSADWFGMPEGGTETPLEYLARLLSEGYPEGLGRLQQCAAAMTPPPVAVVRRRRSRGEFGDTLHMPDVWAGRLDRAWERCERREVQSSTVLTIVTPLAVPYTEGADTLFWRLAAAVAAADALTQAGYSVAIVGAEVQEDRTADKRSSYTYGLTVTIKPADAPLDLSTLSACCHPVFCRGAVYASISRSIAEAGYTNTGSLGHYVEQQLPELAGAMAVPYDTTTQTAAQAWVTRTLSGLETRAAA